MSGSPRAPAPPWWFANPSVAGRVRRGAEPGRDAPEDREGERRLLQQDLVEVPRRQREAGRGSLSGHGRVPRHAIEDRELPEELAGPELRDDLAVTHDPNPAADDDEEAGSDLALPGDDVPRRELDGRRDG